MLRSGRRVIVPPSEVEKGIIIAAYKGGQSTYKVGAALGMRDDKVQYWLKIWNIPLRPVGFQLGERSPRFKGRKIVHGYVLIYNPSHPNADNKGYVRENRLVAANLRGRPLEKGEIAHHSDEIKDNNEPNNIVVMTNAEHTQLHNPRLGTGVGYLSCPECYSLKPHHALGLCRRCYGRLYARKWRASRGK